MTWLYSKKEALLCRLPKGAPNKNEGRKIPNFVKKNAAMLLNHYISAAVRTISTTFGMVTQFDPLDRSER